MNSLTIILTCAALLVAGLIGITLSVPLQAPAVILFGLAAIVAAIQVMKCGSAGVRKCGKKDKTTDDRRQKTEECESLELQNSSTAKLQNQKTTEPQNSKTTAPQNSQTAKLSNSQTSFAWLLSLVAVFYFVVRACLSPVWDLGVEDLMLIVSAGILYLIAGYAVTGKSGILLRQGLAWVVVVLLLLHVGAAAMQLNGGEGYSLSLDLLGAQRVSDGHVTGMYGYYGSFANFAVIAGLLCLSLGVWGRLSVMLRVLMCLLGLVALGLALWSQSRSAAMSLVPALGLFGVLLYISLAQQGANVRHWGRIVTFSLGSLALIAGISAGIYVLKSRVADDVVGDDIVFQNNLRVNYWSMAGEQWVDYPVWGAGSRSFSYECFRYWSPNLASFEANPEFVHNEYLQLLADYGLVGLLMILGLLAWHFYRGGKQVHDLAEKVGENGLKRGSNAMALAIAGMSGMTAMAVHICFDFRTHLLANLLLFVCCAVWILPVAKSRVLKSGSRGVLKSKKGGRGVEDTVRGVPLSLTGTAILAKGVNPGGESKKDRGQAKEGIENRGQTSEDRRQRTEGRCQRIGLALVLLVLGIGAVGLGGQQLWAGLPLIENKMAMEDGAWVPQNVDRDVWIPALEESLARAPQWRRYQRLGTLYRLQAASIEAPEKKIQLTEKAKAAYQASIEGHSFNLVSRINLASIAAENRDYERADRLFSELSEIAKVRERWFEMHSLWANMHQQWASSLWQKQEHKKAEIHFSRAKELYGLSYQYGRFQHYKEWVVEYTIFMMSFVTLLDELNRFQESRELFEECRTLRYWHGRDGLTGIDFFEAQHLYQRGYAVWLKRKPEEAYQMMKKAKNKLIKYRHWKKGNVDQSWHDQMIKIQEIIDFLQQTGVGK